MAAAAVAAPTAVPSAVPAGGGGGGGAAPAGGGSALVSLQSSPQMAGVMALAARLKDYASNAFAEVRWFAVEGRGEDRAPSTTFA